ncbi:MAG: DUF4230 domain-containing protein [Cyclobacteriaceae bacterium]|nr:DUF4230 domain-containing protein [Cyclobacteriaceae bacterium]
MLKLFPWLLIVLLGAYIFLSRSCAADKASQYEIITHTTILQQIEELGNLELVKYRFNEVLDYRKLSDAKMWQNALLRGGNYNPDIKAILIASGEAAGCIDLKKIKKDHVKILQDTVWIYLPQPELCYHKLDLANTRLHTFTREGWWSRLFYDENENRQMMEQAYRNAEKQIEIAAIQSGILEQTRENAKIVLKPFLEEISGKPVVLLFDLPAEVIRLP